MNKKREQVQNFILKYVDKIARGGQNKKLYEDLFASMTDKDFDKFMQGIKNKKITLSVIVPNGKEVKVDIDNNLKIGKELGVNFFTKLTYKGMKDSPDYKTNIEYMVLDLPVRRASQLLSKKIAIPQDINKIDMLSGQVTGESKASKLTMPELQMLTGMGLDKSVVELVKYRGGDTEAANAMNNLLYKYGSVTQEQLEQYSGGVKSSKVFKAYLNASHIKTTGL